MYIIISTDSYHILFPPARARAQQRTTIND